MTTNYPIFSFPFHKVQDEFPKNSAITQFGGGYSFASAPVGPPQVIFHLKFKVMCWYTQGTPDGPFDRNYYPAALPGTNVATLVDFYAEQQLYNPFWYPHQVRGSVLVRFNKPFTTPSSVDGALFRTDGFWAHLTEPFDLELVMQPT